MDLGDSIAARKMLETMKKHHKNVRAIIFGSAHTEGLTKELKKLKDVNIMIVP